MSIAKFCMYVDFKGEGTEIVELNAKSVCDAMNEAEKLLETKNDVYLSRIMQKTGKVTRSNDISYADYHVLLCNRTNGWHVNDAEHGEGDIMMKIAKYKNDVWMESSNYI